jgi:putative NIF3 family GTP cyclohydrolase 1 type 2
LAKETEATGILVCHDALESVIDEAIGAKCNLVVCSIPFCFQDKKKLLVKIM